LKKCPLCNKKTLINGFHQDKRRQYQRCLVCSLVVVPKQFHLSAEKEKAQYDLHQNNPQDIRYRKFLSRAFEPLVGKLGRGAVGLDFGCGPGPAISVMGAEAGVKIENYDPYYYNNPELLERKYNFITMTEVIEHVSEPGELLSQLAEMMQPGAILAVMTKRIIDQDHFKSWHYKNDLTHICFYSDKTFTWIANEYHWKLEIIDKDVVYLYN